MANTVKIIVDVVSPNGTSQVKATLRQIPEEVRRINKETAEMKKRTDRIVSDSTKTRVREELAEEKRLERDRKKAATEFIASIKKVERESKTAASRISDSFKGGFFGSLVGIAATQLSLLPQMLRSTLDEMVRLSAERQNAFKGLESIATFKGIDQADAKRAVESFRLVRAGVISTADAVVALKNLLATGFSLPQAQLLIERFSDAAAFGKQAALSYGDAIKSASEGLKNQNSILVDNVGITKNLSVIMKERGFQLEDLSDKTKKQSALLALYNGLIEESAAQVGDADKLTQGWTGSTSALSQAQEKLYAAIGDIITVNPGLIATIQMATDAINGQTSSIEGNNRALGHNQKNWVSWAADVIQELVNVGDAVQTTVGAVAKALAGIVVGAVGTVQATINLIPRALNGILESVEKMPPWLQSLMGIPAGESLGRIPLLGDEFATLRQSFGLLNDAFNRDWGRLNQRVNNRRADFEFRQEQIGFEREQEAFKAAQEKFRQATQRNNRTSIPDPGTFTGGGTASGRKITPPKESDREFRQFFEEKGFEVVRTFGKSLNKGSLHPSGMAADIRTHGKSVQEIFELTAAALEKGYRAFDERLKAPGVNQTGPHFHFERGGRLRESRFLSAEYYGGEQNLAYLKALDAKRLGKGGFDGTDFERFVGQQSDQVTQAEREARLRKAFDIFKMMGWTPGALLDDFTKLLVEDAKKGLDVTGRGAGIQPTKNDVAVLFENFRGNRPLQQVSGGDAQLGTQIANRLTLDEEHIRNLRISLGLVSDSADQQDRYTQLILRQNTLEQEIGVYLEDQSIYRKESALNLEREYQVLVRRNKAEDAALASARERNELQRQINDAEDRMANAGANSAERYRLAWLNAINEVRDANIAANESIIRSNVILDEQHKVSSTQIKARVLDHLAQQRSMSETIADEIIGVFEKAASGIDKLLDKAGIGKVPVIGGIAKAMARNQLTEITRGLLDRFLPGAADQMEKAENPMLFEAKQHTKLLDRIARNTGGTVTGVPGLSSSGQSLGGNIFSQIFGGGSGGGLPFFNLSGTGGQGNSGALGTHEAAHASQHQSGGMGGLGGLFGNLFAPKQNVLTGNMSRMGGIAGGIGSIATMAGGLVGGRWGNAISMAGMGLQIGSMFGPWGAAIGGAIGGGIGIIQALLGGDDAIKKLRQAASSEFGITVKDKNVLKQLKQIGEGYFGKGQAGKNAIATVRTEEGMNILRAYAESSGQSGLKIDRLNYGDQHWEGNQFRSRFGGFREMGGDVRRGMAYVVGERQPELFVPHTNGTILPAVPNASAATNSREMAAVIERMTVVIGQFEETIHAFGSRVSSLPAGQVVAMGARENPDAIAEAYNGRLQADPRANERLARERGEWN